MLLESDIESFIRERERDDAKVSTLDPKPGFIDEARGRTWKAHLSDIYKDRLKHLQKSNLHPELQEKVSSLLERLDSLKIEDQIYFWIAKSSSKTYSGLADSRGVTFYSSSDWQQKEKQNAA